MFIKWGWRERKAHSEELQAKWDNVAIESAAKGIMAVAGGFGGKGIGALMFGPAGAYVFGGVIAVAATTESHWLSDRVDTVINPDRDEALSAEAKKLLQTCIEHLEAKVLGIEVKANSLPLNQISDAMRYRWKWYSPKAKSMKLALSSTKHHIRAKGWQ